MRGMFTITATEHENETTTTLEVGCHMEHVSPSDHIQLLHACCQAFDLDDNMLRMYMFARQLGIFNQKKCATLEEATRQAKDRLETMDKFLQDLFK